MLTPSKTPENNWQLMRAQPKLKKPLQKQAADNTAYAG